MPDIYQLKLVPPPPPKAMLILGFASSVLYPKKEDNCVDGLMNFFKVYKYKGLS
jgi:hypothetical protein